MDAYYDSFDYDDRQKIEWSNDKIMEFLQLFQTEPCLWNPRQKAYKNRSAQADAWRRIMDELSFPVTIEDLKKKKETLMGYYRILSNKYKKALKSGTVASEMHTTSWFAYDTMHSFLHPIYLGDGTLDAEPTSPVPETETTINTEPEAAPRYTRHPLRSGIKRRIGSHPNFHQSPGQLHSFLNKVPAEIITAKKQMNEAFDCLKALANPKETKELDEYDHFALMLAAKIRKIDEFDERELLMNTVQNVVFQSIVKSRNTLNNSVSSWPQHSHNQDPLVAVEESERSDRVLSISETGSLQILPSNESVNHSNQYAN